MSNDFMAERNKAWQGFELGNWSETIDTRDFIQKITNPIPEQIHFWKSLQKTQNIYGIKLVS